MKRTAVVIGIVILANACIWGFAMIMSSRALSGTGAYQQIEHILSGSAAMSLLVVGGGLSGLAMGSKSGTSTREEG
jgi:hypothetical protein